MDLANTRLLIGGGMASRPFYYEMFELCGKRPTIAFELSSRTSEETFNSSRENWQKKLVDRYNLPEPIWLEEAFDEGYAADTFDAALDEADALFVAGGSTTRCFSRWQELGVTQIARERVADGDIVGSGVSSGALIWFASGLSDSPSYKVNKGDYWEYTESQGVGLLPGVATPHYSDTDDRNRQRAEEFSRLLSTHSSEYHGIGIDFLAALSITDGKAKVLRTDWTGKIGSANAYIHRQDGTVLTIPEEFSFPFAALTDQKSL